MLQGINGWRLIPPIQWFLLWMCAAAFKSIKYQGLYESKVFSNNTTTHTLNLPQLLKQRIDLADC